LLSAFPLFDCLLLLLIVSLKCQVELTYLLKLRSQPHLQNVFAAL
jgi:hypothetical protein